MTMIWDDDGAPAREHPAMALIAAAASRLVGLAALALGLALAAAIASYDANDPSYFTATGRAATNWLGGPGALIADFAMHGIGLAGWVVVALVLVWGWRLALARGDERFWSRLPAMPLAVAAVAVLASLAAPGPGWPVGGGLGGLLGDRAASVLVHSFEMAPETARGRLLPGVGVLALILTLLALGLSRGELRAAWARLRRLPDEPEPAPSPRAKRPAARAEDAPSRPGRVGRLARGALAGAVPALRRAGASVVRFGATLGGGLAGLAPSRSPAAAPAGPARGIEPVLRSIAGDDAPTAPRPRPAPPRTEAPSRDPAPADLPVETDEDEADDDEIDLTPPAAEDGPVVKPRKPLTLGRGARSGGSAQPVLFAAADDAPYDAPPLDLLARSDGGAEPAESEAALAENARALETVLDDYGVRGEIAAVKPGPVVTLYELEPAPGLKAQRVIGLADDIARSMSALSARIATVPGRSVIGIELPNEARETVWLRDVFEGRAYAEARFPLALALGRDIEGEPVIANLAKMPHLLIAGTTGSGKSVAINTMILSLLYRLSPRQCRLIMIDPKMLELSVYDDIPHLLAPVVTDPKKAVVALKWVVAEMEERYRRMSKLGVRNIDGYNARCRDAIARGENFSRTIQTGFEETTGEPIYETQEFAPEEMPLIVVIVDEMADLMMVAGKEIEACIQRLAQMARASGIHLIMATQRPSVDVITGTIKANFPTRISFSVTSKIDSRTILGEQGAEQLLGQGDMLYMSGGGRIRRVHGPFVSDEEVEEVVRHLKAQGTPDYVEAVTEGGDDETASLVDEKLGLGAAADGDDVLYDKAVAIVARDRKCSTSYIQRKLAIGYNKAARLVEQMETEGVVSPANAVGKREILVAER